MPTRWSPLLMILLAGCPAGPPDGDDDATEDVVPWPFIDDCEESTGAIEGASGIEAVDGWHQDDVQLCEDEIDVYRLEVPAGRYVSVEVRIDGSGRVDPDDTDFDLWEVPDDWEGDTEDALWSSASEQPRERLAWASPQGESRVHYLVVDGYDGSYGTYSLVVQESEWSQEKDCDDAYPDVEEYDEDGPCNRILQAAQRNDLEDGYLVTHEARYSNIRREVLYLVQWAARMTHERFPDEPELALMDMSEWDGDTPGAEDDSLRHPEGTHVDGNDMDIAYFQTGPDNLGRAVCENDGYFCEEEPDILDATKTAYFLGMLLEGDSVRVIGMDPMIWEMVDAAGLDLWQDDEISTDAYRAFDDVVAWGEGWPFHHHHMHLSWLWESGYARDLPAAAGCMTVPNPALDAHRPR